MLRACLLACTLTTVGLGCNLNNPNPADSSDDPDASDSNSAPGASYTLKFRDEKKGDIFVATETSTGSIAAIRSGRQGSSSEIRDLTQKFEYTEVVIEPRKEGSQPAKFIRTYKTAEVGAEGSTESESYVGKTVLFEKKRGRYSITVAGRSLPEAEEQRLRKPLEMADKLKDSDMVPTTPVRLKEEWALSPAVVRGFAEHLEFPIDKEKSHGTGKLIKVYTKEDRQWGVFHFKVTLVVANTTPGVKVSGTINLSSKMDAVIDGTSSELTVRDKVSGTIIDTRGPNKLELNMNIDDVVIHAPPQ